MKKNIYVLIVSLVVISVLVFSFTPFAKSSGEIKNETSKKSISKPLSAAEMRAARKKWEATPDGIMFKKWEESPAGKKVYASEAKIRKSIKEFANMEGVVASLSLPPGSRLGLGIMIQINGADYILSFGSGKLNKKELERLKNLKVNDKIIIKSQNVSHAPKYSYPILSGDYVEKDGVIIYKRDLGKDGC